MIKLIEKYKNQYNTLKEELRQCTLDELHTKSELRGKLNVLSVVIADLIDLSNRTEQLNEIQQRLQSECSEDTTWKLRAGIRKQQRDLNEIQDTMQSAIDKLTKLLND